MRTGALRRSASYKTHAHGHGLGSHGAWVPRRHTGSQTARAGSTAQGDRPTGSAKAVRVARIRRRRQTEGAKVGGHAVTRRRFAGRLISTLGWRRGGYEVQSDCPCRQHRAAQGIARPVQPRLPSRKDPSAASGHTEAAQGRTNRDGETATDNGVTST